MGATIRDLEEDALVILTICTCAPPQAHKGQGWGELTHSSLYKIPRGRYIIIPTLQMRKLRVRKFKKTAQSPRARKAGI